jgi:HEPN domain-containing protein
MRKRGQDPETADEWMFIALRDLIAAEHLPILDKEMIVGLSANSAEKCLKAFLFSFGERDLKEYGHNLDRLIKKCIEVDRGFLEIQDDVSNLREISYKSSNGVSNCGPHYEIYNPNLLISDENANIARQSARRIYEFIRSKFSKEQ